jgi:chromosome segregation protein
VFLKTLTLRGFKSFASSTTLQFEPGITCVVGPNGSGKSNVVDALAWVMGEQGAKSLRGGSMSDVIFAGTPSRPALGRAEVVLTIDNGDRALPVDADEVTISRTLFSGGASEYAINARPCRLLDVTELLSDSGIGREMHVIVGQGQLDTVLHATPEVRRGLVEEAAGVLKHRKRKEKALRKLDATAANMARLSDLTAELRRQLTPLARQAEAARRAATVQAEVRDARLRLLADDLVRLDARLRRDEARRAELSERRVHLDTEIAELATGLAALDAAEQAESGEGSTLTRLVTDLTALRERVDGTLALARARSQLLLPEPEAGGPDPLTVDAQAAEATAEAESLDAVVAAAAAGLAEAVVARQEAEQVQVAAERLAADREREQARRVAEVARLGAQVESLRAAMASAADELRRLRTARSAAQARAARAREEFVRLESGVGGLSAGEERLDAEHEAAQAALDAVQARLRAAGEAERQAERERTGAQGRIDALTLALGRPDATAALLADPAGQAALAGTVAAAVQVEPGAESAVAAVLGDVADAAVARGLDAATALLHTAASARLGRAVLLVGSGPDATQGPAEPVTPDQRWPAVPAGLRYLVEAVSAPEGLREAVRAVLGPAVAVRDLSEARAVVAEVPGVLAVTGDGTLLGSHLAVGGPAGGSRVELQAELDRAREWLAQAEAQSERLRFERAGRDAEHAEARSRLEAAVGALHESDAELAALAERLGRLNHDRHAAEAEADRLATSEAAVAARLADDEIRLSDLSRQTDQAHARAREAAGLAGGEPDSEHADAAQSREVHAERVGQARQAEVTARLELRTVEERQRIATSRARTLAEQAGRIRRAQADARDRRRRAERQAAVAGWVAGQAQRLATGVAAALAAAQAERDAHDAAGARRRAARAELAARTDATRVELERVVDALHSDEVALAEVRLLQTATRERARDEGGADPESLVEEYGPHREVPLADGTTVPYTRAEQEARAEKAERALVRLGRVNPLALEEHAAAEERLRYLTGQLDDLQRTRRDLLGIVHEVDERVQAVFAEAFTDTAREFEAVFARLFPGGEGRLLLTDPGDMLSTGIEVEARPPGKRVKRLSLLSGGERSLVAVAFLVALFLARPSPFYVLDEVEAALDDTNLGRLLDLYEQLRASSQLLVVTHQKRTMEIADALYGVTMRSDGVSAVISQRLREAEAV